MLSNIVIIRSQKNTLLEEWILNPHISDLLLSHKIQPLFFKEHFASHIFDYLLTVLNKDVSPGTCRNEKPIQNCTSPLMHP